MLLRSNIAAHHKYKDNFMDVFTKEKRSEVMSKIRAKNTKPELIVRKILYQIGCRFRLHNKHLPGKPDICMRKHNTIIFVHGCFWHYHQKCRDGKIPKSNVGYWQPKIERNTKRDKENKAALKKLHWKVLTIWECETRDTAKLEKRLRDYFKMKKDN